MAKRLFGVMHMPICCFARPSPNPGFLIDQDLSFVGENVLGDTASRSDLAF